MKYLFIYCLLFVSLIGIAQTSDFNTSLNQLERLMEQTEVAQLLEYVHEWESGEKGELSLIQADQLRVLKAKALIEIQMIPEALDELQQISSLNDLPPTYQLDFYLQRALANEWLSFMEQTGQALNRAEQLFKKYPETIPIRYGQYLYRKASYHRINGQDSLFHKYAHESLGAGKKYGDKKSEMISSVLVAFCHEKDYPDSSLLFLNRAVDLSKQLKASNMEGYTLANISGFYFNNNEYKKAINYINQAYEIAEKKDLNLLRSQVYKTKSQIYERMAMPDSSLANFKKYYAVEKTIDFEQKKLIASQVERSHSLKLKKLENEKLLDKIKAKHRSEQLLRFFLIAALIGLGALTYLLRDVLLKRNLLRQKKQTIELQNNKLQDNLEEKELLLRELNHRVKNNLAMILSLVRLQKDKPDTDHEACENLENRINAIVYAHQMHSYTNQVHGNMVNLKEYCHTLFDSLTMMSEREVKQEIDIAPVETKVKNVLPIGIMLNELVANSIKHAKPLDDVLKISFSLKDSEKEWILNYSDNGEEFIHADSNNSVGLTIINDMVEQLDGVIERNNSAYHIIFRKS